MCSEQLSDAGAMTSPGTSDSRRAGLVIVVGMAVLMWVSEVVDQLLGRLDSLGIEPRSVDGLSGVVLAPFLHAGFGHLAANTVPFLVMGALIALSGARRVMAVTVIVVLVSGVVFGYAAYLVARGVFDRRLHYVATGVLVAFLYGTSLLFGLLPQAGISWQGHLFGTLGGVLAARVLAGRPVARTSPRPGAA